MSSIVKYDFVQEQELINRRIAICYICNSPHDVFLRSLQTLHESLAKSDGVDKALSIDIYFVFPGCPDPDSLEHAKYTSFINDRKNSQTYVLEFDKLVREPGELTQRAMDEIFKKYEFAMITRSDILFSTHTMILLIFYYIQFGHNLSRYFAYGMYLPIIPGILEYKMRKNHSMISQSSIFHGVTWAMSRESANILPRLPIRSSWEELENAIQDASSNFMTVGYPHVKYDKNSDPLLRHLVHDIHRFIHLEYAKFGTKRYRLEGGGPDKNKYFGTVSEVVPMKITKL
jgi:hypothetical protein